MTLPEGSAPSFSRRQRSRVSLVCGAAVFRAADPGRNVVSGRAVPHANAIQPLVASILER